MQRCFLISKSIFLSPNLYKLLSKWTYSKLTQDFFNVPAEELAKNLLGKMIVRQDNNIFMRGVIVETEAYLGTQDLAAHSSKGMMKRAAHTFLPSGTCGFTTIHGHTVFSISCFGKGACVLIRALEPVSGIHKMIINLNFGLKKSRTKEYRICSGPGKLCKALNLKPEMNGIDIGNDLDDLFLTESACLINENNIVICPRIGLNKINTGKWFKKCLRYYVLGHSSVSKRSIKCEKTAKKEINQIPTDLDVK